jgi:uncharacterized protein YndB with AHSA1/START domain
MAEKAAIQIEHEYSAKPSAVWRCLTDPQLLAKWWAAGNVKAEVGHRFNLDMGPFGKQTCLVLEVSPERLLKYKFSDALNTTITWVLAPSAQGTRLKLTHEGFDLGSPMGQQAYQGMKAGWPHVLERMAAVLVELNRV